MPFLLPVGQFEEGARGVVCVGGGIIWPYHSLVWSGFASGVRHVHWKLTVVVRCVQSSGDGPPTPVV